jgi:hypothetical protein
MDVSDFQALISASRFSKYSCVNKYVLSVDKASRMQQMLHWVEIGYRNHIYVGIQGIKFDTHSCFSWLTCTCPNLQISLNEGSIARIKRAKKLLNESDQNNPNKIIPELSFGFWVRLLSSANEQNIWTAGLHKSFPRKTNRSDLHNRLRRMNLIRNRIAHLEPVDNYSLPQIAEESVSLINLIAPNLNDFMLEEFKRIQKNT